MSNTINKCNVVNMAVEKLEKEISEITLDVIDDSKSSLKTTYSSDKINELIGDTPGTSIIDDTKTSSTTTFSSSFFADILVNPTNYVRTLSQTNTRMYDYLFTFLTIPTVPEMRTNDYLFTISQTDSYTSTVNATITYQFVGNVSGTIYYTNTYALTPNHSVTFTDQFTLKAEDVDASDTQILYKIRSQSGSYWSATFVSTCKYVNTILLT